MKIDREYYEVYNRIDHRTQAELYELLLRNPGMHLSKLSKRVEVSLSTVRYHIRELQSEGLITSEKQYGRRCFSPKRSENSKENFLLSDSQTTILEELARNPDSTVSELADELDRDPSTISYHLQRLADAGIVKREQSGRTVSARITPKGDQALAQSSPMKRLTAD